MYRTLKVLPIFSDFGLPFLFVLEVGCPFWGLKGLSGWSVNIGQAGIEAPMKKGFSWHSMTVPDYPLLLAHNRKKSQFDEKMKREKKISHPFLGHLIVAHQGPLKCESRRPKRSQFFGGHSFFNRITQGFIDAKFSGFGKALDFPSFLLAQKKI